MPLADRHHPWVILGGSGLAAVAGYVNAVILGVFHVPVSHVTGAVSLLSIDLAARDVEHLLALASIVGAFLLGAVVSGAVVGGHALRAGRRYGVVLMIESAFLGAAALASCQPELALPLAAMACGLQNAMASSFHGLIIRTTHMTGIVTDLGANLGMLLRGRRVAPFSFWLLLTLLASFFAGGYVGFLAEVRFGTAAVGFAAPATFLGGLGYYLWRHVRRAEAE